MTNANMETTPVDNGVNVDALLGAREALDATPAAAQFKWRTETKWTKGTHSQTTIGGFSVSVKSRTATTSSLLRLIIPSNLLLQIPERRQLNWC